MTKAKLEALAKAELAQLAKKKGIPGWQSMNKDELIQVLMPAPNTPRAKSEKRLQSRGRATKPYSARPPVRTQVAAARDTSNGPSAEEEVERSKYEIGVPTKNLSARAPKDLPSGYGKDRIVAMVRDPYWLHCYWELTRQAVERAESALGQEWHTSKPILRLVEVSRQDTTNSADSIVKDIQIHGGTNNWYIDVANPPRSYRVDIGYLSPRGRFYVLARSNVVSTPRAGVSDVIDENWAEFDSSQADRIYAMSAGFDPTASSLELKQLFEERLRRPLGSPAITSFGSGSWLPGRERKFWFQLDAELIVYGATEPKARVTLQGEPVKLRPDGTFTMRFSLPDSRQILPAVATSPDGVEERTIILAVERNTKHLETAFHEYDEGALT
jgi:hypothetical protein